MKLYQLRSKQVLPISKKEAWDFLSSPANLKEITPDHMGFNILSGDDRPMFAGQIIQYKVSPFPFYSTKWVYRPYVIKYLYYNYSINGQHTYYFRKF